MRLSPFLFSFSTVFFKHEANEKAKSNKIGRIFKHARKPEIPTMFSIYHNILHKYTFQYCINIQKLAYKTRD